MAEVIVALDLPTGRAALQLVDRLPGLRWVKVGPVLFVREGPALIGELKARGVRVFLDLKWHDIPNTVAEAARHAAALQVDLATVHALGGRAMLEAAVAAAGALRLAAVTVLTSHTAESYGEAVGRDGDAEVLSEVVRLARLAVGSGVGALVTSPHEAAAVAEVAGPDRWLVVPGIRPEGSEAHDQKRAATPREAVAAGATHLVVGRPVTGAERPAEVYQEICEAVS
ncbi:MAG: orotidine-5'-phosphate decarboxylase [Gemmatimonadota bacterium]|nr:MAG: orotidine-5'-phosphate decarboxylase [Gemmatimonadota bacterium]